MKVNKPVARKDDEPPLVAYVVIGDGPRAGQIKTVRYNYNMWNDHLLTVERVKQDGVITFIESVNIRGNLQDKGKYGWFILDDEYDRMEAECGDGRWTRAKKAWYEYQAACEAGMVRNPSFPDQLLPPRVLELREIAKKEQSQRSAWVPPSDVADMLSGSPAAETPAEESPKPKRGRPKKAPAASPASADEDKGDLPLPTAM